MKALCTAALFAVIVIACGSPGGSGGSSIALGKTHPDPILSVPLDLRSVLEFYEIDHQALVMERGPAEVTHVPFMTQHAAEVAANRLIDLYLAAKPGEPVPSALADLQTRYPTIDPSMAQAEATPAASTSLNSSEGLPAGGFHVLALDSACGNGCCDRTWVTNSMCSPYNPANSYQWLLYEYGYSAEDSNTYGAWGAAVCAGRGTSIWQLNPTDGGPFTWTVYENTYLTTSDHPRCSPPGSFCLSPSVTTTVNTSSHQELHDYCGGVWY